MTLLLTASYGCDDARSSRKDGSLLDDTPNNNPNNTPNNNPNNNSPLGPLAECEALCDRLGAECADDLRAAGCSEAALAQVGPTCREACASPLPQGQLLALVDFECAETAPALLNILPELEAACQPTCTDGCDAAGATRCGVAGDVETCEEGASGCLEWVATPTCGAGRVCDDSAGAAACVCSGEVWEGDFVGDSTAELEGFRRVQGDIDLQGGGADLLAGLTCLEEVTGSLDIEGNDALTDVDELSSLTTVGDRLAIFFNSALTDVDGLSSLTTVGGSLDISQNDALVNVDGLSSLTAVIDYLRISTNRALVDVSGLSSLMSVGGALDITNNRALCAEEVTALIELLNQQLEPDPVVGDVSGNAGTCGGN